MARRPERSPRHRGSGSPASTVDTVPNGRRPLGSRELRASRRNGLQRRNRRRHGLKRPAGLRRRGGRETVGHGQHCGAKQAEAERGEVGQPVPVHLDEAEQEAGEDSADPAGVGEQGGGPAQRRGQELLEVGDAEPADGTHEAGVEHLRGGDLPDSAGETHRQAVRRTEGAAEQQEPAHWPAAGERPEDQHQRDLQGGAQPQHQTSAADAAVQVDTDEQRHRRDGQRGDALEQHERGSAADQHAFARLADRRCRPGRLPDAGRRLRTRPPRLFSWPDAGPWVPEGKYQAEDHQVGCGRSEKQPGVPDHAQEKRTDRRARRPSQRQHHAQGVHPHRRVGRIVPVEDLPTQREDLRQYRSRRGDQRQRDHQQRPVVADQRIGGEPRHARDARDDERHPAPTGPVGDAPGSVAHGDRRQRGRNQEQRGPRRTAADHLGQVQSHERRNERAGQADDRAGQAQGYEGTYPPGRRRISLRRCRFGHKHRSVPATMIAGYCRNG